MGHILIIDDEEDVCMSCAKSLEGEGYTVHTAQSVKKGIETIKNSSEMEEPYALALVDMRFKNFEGNEESQAHAGKLVVDAALKIPFLEVIVMTAYGDVENAVEMMGKGVYTYIDKKRIHSELLLHVKRAFEHRALRQRAEEADKMLLFVANKLHKVDLDTQECIASLDGFIRTKEKSTSINRGENSEK